MVVILTAGAQRTTARQKNQEGHQRGLSIALLDQKPLDSRAPSGTIKIYLEWGYFKHDCASPASAMKSHQVCNF